MTRIELYKAVFDLLPEDLRERAFIGGGAAVSVDGARDIDLWIITDEVKVGIDAPAISRHLHARGVRIDPIEGAAYAQIVPDMAVLKFGTIPEGFNKPVQIMLAYGQGYNTVEDVLAMFDLSVHQHAWTTFTTGAGVDFRYHTVETSTTPDDAIVITQTRTPEWTYQRYIRLCHRYGHNPSIWQISKLGLTSDKILELDARLEEQEGISRNIAYQEQAA